MREITEKYLKDFTLRHPECEPLIPEISKSVRKIVSMRENNKILICGNGGSAADSEHMAGELLKSFMLKRDIDENSADNLMKYPDGKLLCKNLQEGVKIIPLTSFVAFTTAYINDCNKDFLFAQAVNSLGSAGDILFAISTSGNSKNIIYAAETAKSKGLTVIALTGRTGGQLKNYADILLNVPEDVVWKVQELHLPVYHLICLCVEEELFDSSLT